MSPSDALDKAIHLALVSNRRFPAPGAIIARLSPETREALRKLTSNDVANVRPDAIF